jgi:hypothetical protein
MRRLVLLLPVAICVAIGVAIGVGCGDGQAAGPLGLQQGSAPDAAPAAGAPIVDLTCDHAPYPSPVWLACEAVNFAHTGEAPLEQLANVTFMEAFTAQGLANVDDYLARDLGDPSWLLASSPVVTSLLGTAPAALTAGLQDTAAKVGADPQAGLSISLDSPLSPLCATWGFICVGDPFRYPATRGADGQGFYQAEAEVVPVVFYDRGCARLSGRVWKPRLAQAGANLPGIVIENGSVQAPETFYWWAAQLLVRHGYMVLTFDPRGQGRSDWETPDALLAAQLGQGGNVNGRVFWEGFVDAIDFFHSTPDTPYPHNARCAASYPTAVTAYNPFHDALDHHRLGIAGHSYGAVGVTVVQSYGAPGADPWPGLLDAENPVDVAVAWDALGSPADPVGAFLDPLDPGLGGVVLDALAPPPPVVANKPALGMSSEYGLVPVPFALPPDRQRSTGGFHAWQAAGVPVFQLTVRGSTHFEWSRVPLIPATSWCPRIENGACAGGWAPPMIDHYTLAWFDRWLKRSGETGYADADARLLDDAGSEGANKMSFHFDSARDFPDRAGRRQACENIREGCGLR